MIERMISWIKNNQNHIQNPRNQRLPSLTRKMNGEIVFVISKRILNSEPGKFADLFYDR